MSTLTEAIGRLRALRMHVTVSLEDNLDTAICSLTDTGVPYRNPHYAHEKGWNVAQGESADKGAAIKADIKAVCDELERLIAASPNERTGADTGTL